MNTAWARVRLGDVLRFIPRPVTVEPARAYREIGIQSHGRGIFHKPGGAGRNRTLNRAAFLNQEIRLPPLAEQRRVVRRIEELAAQIREARALRQQTVGEAGALLITRGGKVFARIATQWPVLEFGSFFPLVTSGPRNWGGHYDQNGTRFYRAQDIGPNGQMLTNSKVFVAPPAGEQGRSAMLQRGDLMLVITGATVGRVTVFRDGLEPGLVSQHVAICRLPADQVDREFALCGDCALIKDKPSCSVNAMARASPV